MSELCNDFYVGCSRPKPERPVIKLWLRIDDFGTPDGWYVKTRNKWISIQPRNTIKSVLKAKTLYDI